MPSATSQANWYGPSWVCICLLPRRGRPRAGCRLRDHADRKSVGRGERPHDGCHLRAYPLQVRSLQTLHPLRRAVPRHLQCPDLYRPLRQRHRRCSVGRLCLHRSRHALHPGQHPLRRHGRRHDHPQRRPHQAQCLPRHRHADRHPDRQLRRGPAADQILRQL